MIANPSIPIPTEPKLLDLAFKPIQTALASGLSWLNTAYGKAEKHVETIDDRQIYFPAVYAGTQEYLKVFPDDHLGNFSFFDVDNGLDLGDWTPFQYQKMTADFALIIWFDIRDVYPADHQERTLANVASDVLQVLKDIPAISLHRITDRAEDIYKGYTANALDPISFMRPCGALRFEGQIWFNEQCL